MKNKLKDKLLELGLSSESSFEIYSEKVRDREGMKAYRCNRSQVILLDYQNDNVSAIYEDRKDFDYWSQSWNKDGKQVNLLKANINDDDIRRANLLRPIVRNKNLLDFGTGMGGILRLLENETAHGSGLELQAGPREYLNNAGINCYKHLSEIKDEFYDVITMFHVFEHLDDPVSILKNCKPKLKKKGKLIIEVPHARDALLSIYDSLNFKEFTLWSEHLLLHTKESLRLFIENSGFKVTSIRGVQRYPVANHLYWLSKKLPGGQNAWPFLNSEGLNREYEAILAASDTTDTIIAFCETE